jgi:hypothetical protein
VLSGFLRVVTHPAIFTPPSPMTNALSFVEELRSQPNCVPVGPGQPSLGDIRRSLPGTRRAREPGTRRVPCGPRDRVGQRVDHDGWRLRPGFPACAGAARSIDAARPHPASCVSFPAARLHAAHHPAPTIAPTTAAAPPRSPLASRAHPSRPAAGRRPRRLRRGVHVGAVEPIGALSKVDL